MNMLDNVEQILATLTPERLRAIILDIARARPADRPGVSLPDILDELSKGLDLGTGAEGWAATLQIKKAIIDAVAVIPDMQYVEGDA